MFDFSGLKIIVYGDVMIDEYVYGVAERLSPEAPVPVIREVERKRYLGGAGNVAANVKAMGVAQTFLLTDCGNDRGAIKDLWPSVIGFVNESRKLRKTRIYAGNQQVARIDDEVTMPIDKMSEGWLFSQVHQIVTDHSIHAVIVSDYDKGVVTGRTIRSLREIVGRNVPIFLGMKHDLFTGADWIMLNYDELQRTMMHLKTQEERATNIVRSVGSGLVTTMGKSGIHICEKTVNDVRSFGVPTIEREVYDVAGAGDSALAAFALAKASGMVTTLAAELANAAGGIAVSRRGTHAVFAAELREATSIAKDAGHRTIGFANGVFDMLHPGHVDMLEQARRQCDYLIVAINTDASAERIKRRPFHDQFLRAKMLSELRCVDTVLTYDADTAIDLINRIRPAKIFRGDDGVPVEAIVGYETIKAWGGEIIVIPKRLPFSTTGSIAWKENL